MEFLRSKEVGQIQEHVVVWNNGRREKKTENIWDKQKGLEIENTKNVRHKKCDE